MTSEVKSYIDLSDILKMRFECTDCHAGLELDLEKVKEKSLWKCPNCGFQWTAIPNPGGDFNIHEQAFISLATLIRDIDKSFEKTPFGFRIKLQINNPSQPR